MLSFMGEHPFLTFFLATVIGETVIRSIKYARGIPDSPSKCPKCGFKLVEDEDEESE
jgi:hypothetical protein